jgi:membrane-associated protease RseP (regulator of RpoE activity)
VGLSRVPGRSRLPIVNLVLFLATLGTTLLAGAGQVPLPQGGSSLRGFLAAGLPFAASIVAILLCHELGHYLLARAYRVDTTLPYFIPVPFGVGTLGAVIRIRSAMPSRRAVLDIGSAGPIAGFLVAVPLYAWGLAHSRWIPVDDAALGASNVGSPWALLRALLRGETLQALAGNIELMGDSLVTWGVGRWVLGPTPPGYDVLVHPVAFAAWIGLFVTTLNLIPIGQLDGGHVLYALLGGRRAHLASQLVSRALLLCGVFLSWNWLLWWLLTRAVVGLRHPPALAEEPLTAGRRAVALLSLLLFAATFVPVPFAL